MKKTNAAFGLTVLVTMGTLVGLPAFRRLSAQTKATPETMRTIISEFPKVAMSRNADDPWFELFQSFPHEDAITLLAHALDSDPAFREVEVRRFAYIVGSLHAPEEFVNGQAFLVRGLKEPDRSIQTNCLRRLATRRAELDKEVRASVLDLWNEGQKMALSLSKCDASVSLDCAWIQALADASAQLDDPDGELGRHLLELFRSERVEGKVRASAVGAMLQIIGVERVLSEHSNVDPLGRSALLWALSRFVTLRKAEGRLDDKATESIRVYYVASLKDSVGPVRASAVRGVRAVFGEESSPVQTGKALEVAFEVRAILTDLARNDPDETVQRLATDVLDRDPPP